MNGIIRYGKIYGLSVADQDNLIVVADQHPPGAIKFTSPEVGRPQKLPAIGELSDVAIAHPVKMLGNSASPVRALVCVQRREVRGECPAKDQDVALRVDGHIHKPVHIASPKVRAIRVVLQRLLNLTREVQRYTRRIASHRGHPNREGCSQQSKDDVRGKPPELDTFIRVFSHFMITSKIPEHGARVISLHPVVLLAEP
ncbi:hypothetical protein ES703_07174 [subsurface metagenome]